jgi:hypothetical protein
MFFMLDCPAPAGQAGDRRRGRNTRKELHAPGAHVLTLAFTPLDENMDRRVNTALLDHLRLTLLAPDEGAGGAVCR